MPAAEAGDLPARFWLKRWPMIAALMWCKSVHDQFTGMIEEHKANKVPQPLAVSSGQSKGVLASCGVPEERVAAFDENMTPPSGPTPRFPAEHRRRPAIQAAHARCDDSGQPRARGPGGNAGDRRPEIHSHPRRRGRGGGQRRQHSYFTRKDSAGSLKRFALRCRKNEEFGGIW